MTRSNLDYINALRIVASCKEVEATKFPWWAIVEKAGLGRIALLAGPYFSRESAEKYLAAHSYRWSKGAHVYCFSGHESPEFREMYAASKDLRGEES